MKKDKNEIKNHNHIYNHNSHNTNTEDENSLKETEENHSKQTLENGSDAQSNTLLKDEELSQAKNKIEELEKEVLNYKDKLLRKAAEFENYKRRTENDQLNLIKYAAESFIIKLLPVIDDLERSLQHIDNAKDIDSLKQGIKLVYDKFVKVLTEQGVKPIEAVGKPFDVHYHDAMLQQPAKNVEPNTVINELEKGYMYKDRVIRHSKVIVSQAPDEGEARSSNSDFDESNNSKDK